MENLFTDLILAWGEAAPPANGNPAGQAGPQSLFGFQCLMPIAILGIFYVLLIRPQQKQQKEHAKLVSEIKSGTKVVAAGMVGTISTVKKNSIILRSADSKVELDRNAIERIIPAHAEVEEESK